MPVAAAPFLWIALAPVSYFRHREALAVAWKLVFFAFPLLRKAKGIQRALDSPATAGPFGFLIDVVRIAWGTRLFTPILLAIAAKQSPIPYAIGQLYSVVMIRMNDSLCKSVLFEDPLTQDRLHAFNTLTTKLVLPTGLLPLDNHKDKFKDCSFFVTLLEFSCAVVIPVTAAATLGNDYRVEGKRLLVAWLFAIQFTWAVSLVATTYNWF
jgi:multisubunit Na+/H+ antiporter MnhF subunit